MNARRLVNWTRVLILFGALAIMGGGVYFAHGFQVRRNAKGLLEQSRLAEQDGESTQAIDYLTQYLGLIPSDTDALAHYGQLLLKQARRPLEKMKAFFVLEQVLRREPARHEVRRDVIRIATELGRFDDARVHLDRLRQDQPPDAELLGLEARCDVASRNFNDAAKHYARAVELDPTAVDLWSEYAVLTRVRLDEPEVADAIVRAMLDANARSLPARLTAARHFLSVGAPDRAEDHVRFMLDELQADDAEVLSVAAAVAQARGKREDAKRELERGLKLHPEDNRLRQELARLEGQTGQREQALELLRPSLKSLPDGANELWSLGNLLVDLKEKAAVGDVLLKLQKAGPSWAVALLRARLSVGREEWGEARVSLEKLLSGPLPGPAVSVQVLTLLAECYAALGNPDQQAATCRQALSIEPASLPARLSLINALMALRKSDEAIEQYRGLFKQIPGARIEVARLLMQKVLAQPPAQRHWEEVDKTLSELSPTIRQSSAGLLLSAQLLAARDKLDEARKDAEAARTADPKRPAPWLFLAELLRRQKKSADIPALLDEAEKQTGKRLEWTLARANYWAKVGGEEGTKHLKELAGTVSGKVESEQVRLLLPLGALYASIGDATTAKHVWQLLADKLPNDVSVRAVLLEEAFRAGDRAATREMVHEIERAEGEGGSLGMYGQAAQAVLTARAGDRTGLADARRNLRRVVALRPSWPRPTTLLGEVEELDGNKDQALREYLDALERGEGRLFVVRHVLQQLFQARRYAEANNLLEKYPEETRASTRLDRFSAELAFLDDRLEDPTARRKLALQKARKVVEGGKSSWQDLLWLGQIAWLAGDLKEAETALRQARDLADKEPATWVALIHLLARTDAARGKVELAEAKRRLPAKIAPLALASCCEALGMKEEAAKYLQAAQTADPDSLIALGAAADFYNRIGDFAKAEPLLRRLLDPHNKTPATVVVAARRSLALMLVRQQGEKSFQDAVELIEENLKAGNSEVDRRAKVIILASRPAHRAEAIRLLEEMAPLEARTPPSMLYMLAQLYQMEGNWPRAEACLLATLRSHDDNAATLSFLIRGLLRQGEVEKARSYLARLEAVAPKDFVSLELRVRLLSASDKKAEAVRLLEEQAKREGSPLDQLAILLDEVGGYEAAERLYRRYLAESKKPESVLLLAIHFGRRGRVKEGLDICEEAWKTCKIEQIASISVVVVNSGKGSESDVRRVEGWLTDALRKSPDSVTLVENMADLYLYADRREDAKKIYRDLLRRNEGNVIALNNLACLLAFEEGKNEEALALINKAISLVGPRPDFLDSRTLILLQSGQPDRALKDAEAVVARAPTAAANFRLAQAQRMAGNLPEATAVFRKAIRQGLKEEELYLLDRAAFRELTRQLVK